VLARDQARLSHVTVPLSLGKQHLGVTIAGQVFVSLRDLTRAARQVGARANSRHVGRGPESGSRTSNCQGETAMTPKKILIVDDDQQLVLGLSPKLRSKGYSVITATDAISAIAVTRREHPDLVILDLGLPGGDGYEVLERLRCLPCAPALPIIVLTARGPQGNKQRSLNAGAVAFFQKPPDNHEFITAVREALGETPALSTFLLT
jgi:CheY-like chemotaxis protein